LPVLAYTVTADVLLRTVTGDIDFPMTYRLHEIPAVLAFLVIGFVLYVFTQGALIHLICQWHVRGFADPTKAIAFVLSRLWPMLAARFLAGFQLLVVGGIGIGLYYVLGPLAGANGLAAFVLIIVMGALIYLAVRWIFIEHAVLIEGCTPQAALDRSELRVKGYWWRVFGILFVIGLIVFIVGAGAVEMPRPILSGLGRYIVHALAFPVYTISVTLLYFDLRVRKENYRVKDLAKDLNVGG